MKDLIHDYIDATIGLFTILLSIGLIVAAPLAYIGIGGYYAYTSHGWVGITLLVIIGFLLLPLWLIVSQRILWRVVT